MLPRSPSPVWIGLGALTACFCVVAADIQSIGPLASDVVSEFRSASLDGTALVGRSKSISGVFTEFVWTASQGYRLPPVGLNQLAGVSADGRYVIGVFNSAAVRWDTTTGEILQLPADMTNGLRISGDGRTITGRGPYNGPGSKMVRWREGTGVVTQNYDSFFQLPDFGPITHTGSVAAANVISRIAGGEVQTSSGFYWDEDGVRRQLGGGAIPTAVTPDGAYLFGLDFYYAGQSFTNLARWRADGTYDILIPYDTDHTFGSPVGVDTAGTTLAMNRNVDGSVVPSLWRTDSGYERLSDYLVAAGIDLSGWTLTRVHGMSADQIRLIGEGVNPSGQSVVWYATVPSPPGIAILALAAIPTKQRRRVACA